MKKRRTVRRRRAAVITVIWAIVVVWWDMLYKHITAQCSWCSVSLAAQRVWAYSSESNDRSTFHWIPSKWFSLSVSRYGRTYVSELQAVELYFNCCHCCCCCCCRFILFSFENANVRGALTKSMVWNRNRNIIGWIEHCERWNWTTIQ